MARLRIDDAAPLRHVPGEAVQRRRRPEHGRQGLGVHRGDLRGIEMADPPLELGGATERLLDRDLLVEREPDEQRQGLGDEQAVGIGVAGERERGERRHARMVVPDC